MDAAVDGAFLTTFLLLALAILELVVGGALGWWLRGGKVKPPLEVDAPPPDKIQLQRASDTLSRLHEVTSRVSADVGEHTSRVQAISDELVAAHGDKAAMEAAVASTVARIVEANEKLQQQLQTAEQRLQEQAQQIEMHAADALTDALTGRANRRAFDAELGRRLAEWQRKQTPFCLLICDVDHFKKFNDKYGHLAGDEVLRGVGHTLHASVREMDIVARYGGEEFAVIIPSTVLAEAQPAADRTRAIIADARFQFETESLQVTLSGGLAQAIGSEDAAALIKRADEALYAAKKGGRNQVYVHDGQATRPLTRPGASIVPPEPQVQASAESSEKSAERTPSDSSGTATRTDHQTGLPNRTAFFEDLRRRVAEAKRYGTTLSVVLVQLDNLDDIKRRHGEPAVDLAFRTASQFLTATMREMDLVARYDADTFGMLLPGTELSRAIAAAARLRAAIGQSPIKGKDFELQFTVSFGLAEAAAGDDSTLLIKRAEAARQASVLAGKNCIHFHNGNRPERLAAREPVTAGV